MDNGGVSESDITKAVDFTYNAAQRKNPAAGEKAGLQTTTTDTNDMAADPGANEWKDIEREALSKEEAHILQMAKNTFGDYFTDQTFAGLAANIERGNLGLKKPPPKQSTPAGDNHAMDEKRPLTDVAPMHPPAVATF